MYKHSTCTGTFICTCAYAIQACIKWKGWRGRFYSDKPGDVDPSFENASVESKTPRHFQADDLYKIAVAEVVYHHHSLWNRCHQRTLVQPFFGYKGLALYNNQRPQPSFIDSWPEYSTCSCLGYLVRPKFIEFLGFQVYRVNVFNFIAG